MLAETIHIINSYESEPVFSIGEILQGQKQERIVNKPEAVRLSTTTAVSLLIIIVLLTAVLHFIPSEGEAMPFALVLLITFAAGWICSTQFNRQKAAINQIATSDEQEIIDEINRLFEG